MKELRGLLIKAEGNYTVEERVIDRESELHEFYYLLDCDYIDIVTRSIGGKEYDIVIDDEGLYKEQPLASGLCRNADETLVGSILVCGVANNEGEMTSLTDEDVRNIKANIYAHDYIKDGESFTGKLLLYKC